MAPRLGQRLVPETERKKHFVAVRLTDVEFDALESISRREELPLSYVIRKAIAMLIEANRKKK